MTDQPADILSESFLQSLQQKRKKLLPWWIKLFCWIFLCYGILAPFTFIAGLTGYHPQTSLYGMTSYDPKSAVGTGMMILFLLKGLTAFCLLWEKKFGPRLGIVDASLGIAICLFVMAYPVFSDQPYHVSFRLELILLIPYLNRMVKIQSDWEKAIKS